MSNAGENRSIWFDSERIEKLEQIALTMRAQTGIKISISAIVGRAIDDLFLRICPSEKTNDTPERQAA